MSRRSLNNPLALQNPCLCKRCASTRGETWPIIPESYRQGPPRLPWIPGPSRPPEMQGRAVPIFAPWARHAADCMGGSYCTCGYAEAHADA
jgi:hypothetical protein